MADMAEPTSYRSGGHCLRAGSITSIVLWGQVQTATLEVSRMHVGHLCVHGLTEKKD